MPEGLTIVPAGAGSGKTFRIKTTLSEWIEAGEVRPERILAVTFTEAAAGELRERIRASLLERGNIDAALDVERAYVSTIHSLGLRILSEHAFAVGASPSARHLSDAERDLLVRQELARCAIFDEIRADLPRFGYKLRRGRTWQSGEDRFRDRILTTIDLLRGLGEAGLSAELAESAVADLRHRYGSVAADPAPLKVRLLEAVSALLTAFPRGCADLEANQTAREAFRKDLANLRAAQEPGRLDRDWELWKALRELRLSKQNLATPAGYDDLAGAVIEAAERIVRHPGPRDDACANLRAMVLGAQEIMRRYGERKRAAGVIDFADMIVEAERVLRAQPDILDALLGEVDCVIVDEFQDTNPIQFALLWRLASRAPRTLLVGDVKQSIMGFQGADPRLSEALGARFTDNVDPLDRNWRSDPRLMEVINALGEGLFDNAYEPLAPQRVPTGQTCLEVLRLKHGRSTRKHSKPPAHVAAHLADLLDADTTIIDRHTDAQRKLMPGDIAVLCPTHSLAAAYADALEALGVPVRLNREGWFAARPVEVARQALALAADPSDTHAALCLLTLGPAAMPLETALARLADGTLLETPELTPVIALAEEAARAPVQTILPRVIAAAALHDWAMRRPDPAQARADLIRLEHEAGEFAAAHRDMTAAAGFHGATLRVFLGWLAAQVDERDFDAHPDPSAAAPEGVEIVTWHASKGREWNVVVVTGLDCKFDPRPGSLEAEFDSFDDLDNVLSTVRLIATPWVPVAEIQDRFVQDRMEIARANARRLLYVATTRARDRLILEWPDSCFDKHGDPGEKSLTTHAALLREETGMSLENGAVQLGGKLFTARIQACADTAPEPENDTAQPGAAVMRYGERRAASVVPATPWRRQPSMLAQHVVPRSNPIREAHLAAPIAAIPQEPDGAPDSAAARGTAWHLAFRGLAQHPGMIDRVASATGLDTVTLQAIDTQARALRGWLAGQGFDEQYFEVPIQVIEASGAQTNGVIDCLARGPSGCAVLDHKSGIVADRSAGFDGYWPQLLAYAEALAETGEAMPVRLLAINWMSEGIISHVAVP